MFPFSRPPLNPPPLAILKVICLFAVQPVCGADQKMVYGVAHGEIASINCTVKANPTAGIRFRWTFNSSAELNTLPQSRYTVSGPTSQVCIILLSGLYFFLSPKSHSGLKSDKNVHYFIIGMPHCLLQRLESTSFDFF